MIENHIDTTKCTDCFKLLGVESRMTIYMLLKQGSKTVSQIAEKINLKQPTISYHLAEMKKSGLLESKKLGKEAYYSLLEICPHFEQECVLKGVRFPNAQNRQV